MQKLRLLNRVTCLWLLAVFFSTIGLAWAAAPLTLTEKDSGKTLTLPVGQQLVVDLRLGAGQYVLAPEFDPSVLALVGQSLQSTSGPQGASSRVVYEFLVQQGGQTELVIAAKGSGDKEGQTAPLLKVKIMAIGGGERV
jgi:hypothetical protein